MQLTELQSMLLDFSKDRPILDVNNTPERTMGLLENEVVEARESLGDEKNLPSEIADIVIFALTLANQMGLNMDEEVRLKVAYNMSRYVASDFQSGEYEQARLAGKAREKEVKPLFYDTV